MDKTYNHKEVEEKIYRQWEESGYFQPEVNPNGKPFSIILPPPNANAPLHFGHALYTVEDVLIRFHRMLGDKSLWLPGADHAGFETQFVYEKKLQEKGKTRFDFNQEELYKKIFAFVQNNRPLMEDQLRRMGFSLDWTRKKFTLDQEVVKLVYKTFKKLYDDGLIYREKRLVNYCTFDGTSFSDLEVIYEERKDPLYYVKYGPLVLATTRPETKFGDTAVAVHPDDKRYEKYVGKEIEIETVMGKAKIKVIADRSVDPEFGTGVVKITPAHDFNDYETGQRHSLPMIQVIDYSGKMNDKAGKYEGLYVKQARRAVVEDMKSKGLIEKIDEDYVHRIGLCYKCKNPIEPLPLEQWFVKMKPLAAPAIKAAEKNEINFYPQRHKKVFVDFLNNIRDWNISRQIVWGIRIPAFKCKKCSEWVVTEGERPGRCKCGSTDLVQDKDTFDTWFSSSQWPFITLMTNKSEDFKTFYPTTVMETMYDILFFWVARMVMMGIYCTGKIPFENVVLHGMVKDPLGKKMSKSKGNVIDPLEIIGNYGADAVRFALVYGTAFGNDQALSYPKLQAMRNFTNKLWNMGRFIETKKKELNKEFKEMDTDQLKKMAKNESDKKMIQKTEKLIKEVTRLLEKYDFNHASQNLYDFTWHEFADKYIEDVKNRIDKSSFQILINLYLIFLKLLHPFMPFVTEELNKTLYAKRGELIVSKWPYVKT